MAEKGKKPEEPKNSILDRDIDPALQAKVDAYMDPRSPEMSDAADSKIPVIKTSDDTSPASAPLLPTDKLPDLEKPKKKIDIKHHDEAEPEPEKEPAESEVTEPETNEETESETPDELTEEETTTEESSEEPEAEPSIDEEAKPDLSEIYPEPEKEADIDTEVELDDDKTEKAVDEIIAAEADEVLEAQDRKTKQPAAATPKKHSGKKISGFFRAIFRNKRSRQAIILLSLLAVAAAGTVPTSRYFILNTAGVRASTSMTVLDDKTGQPLKNVELSLSGKSAKSDGDGNVRVDSIKLGPQDMTVKKAAFAEVSRKITIGWGSNPQGSVNLTPTGSQYSFLISDFLSDKPVSKAEATSGEASARSNEKGEIILTIPQREESEIEIQITAENYRTENLKLPIAAKEQKQLKLVTARKHAFISKRSGKFDLYKIDADGKNEERVLAGTGSEREDGIALVAHPSKNLAALVSTRDGSHNKDGFTLSSLTLVDLENNGNRDLAKSERIQIVDWIGSKLIYVRIAQGESQASPNRHRLISYDVETNSEKELVSTNYFNDVLVANGNIYYSPAIYKVNGTVGLFRISADGSNKKTIYDKEVWNLFRTGYEKLNVSVGQEWYELGLDNESFSKVSGAPPTLKSRVYVDNQERSRSLWIDERDGKGVLIAYDQKTKEDKVIHTQGGLKNPILWLDNDHAVYRVANGQETADYAVSLSGGEPKKIKDVTNTAGVDRWYYY